MFRAKSRVFYSLILALVSTGASVAAELEEVVITATLRPRTALELTRMLEKAGFERIRRHPTRVPLQTSVLVGERAR